MAVPKEKRIRLAEIFSIPQTGIKEIIDQTVKCDGYLNEDLQAITLEKMCEYIGSQEPFSRAWELTLMKVHSELNPSRRIDQALEVMVGNEPIIEPYVPPSEKIFCDTCDSKGFRHKKECPKYK